MLCEIMYLYKFWWTSLKTAGALYGGSKLNPPLLQTKALSAEESQLQSASVRFSQERDAAWLSQVHQNDKPVAWAGFNAQQDRVVAGSGNTPKTLVMFGPMTDSPPAHLDTVMTTLVYPQSTLNIFGMQYTPTSQSTSNCIRLHA